MALLVMNFSSPYGADDRDPQESVWFDNNGLFSAGKTKAPKTLGLKNNNNDSDSLDNLDHLNSIM